MANLPIFLHFVSIICLALIAIVLIKLIARLVNPQFLIDGKLLTTTEMIFFVMIAIILGVVITIRMQITGIHANDPVLFQKQDDGCDIYRKVDAEKKEHYYTKCADNETFNEFDYKDN